MIEDVITSDTGAEILAGTGVSDLITEVGAVVVLDELPVNQVLEEVDQDLLVEDSSVISILSTGVRFIATASEEDMAYAKRSDVVGDSVIYRAEAAPGTLDDQPLWRIRRLTISPDGDVVEQWANGAATFVNVWLDHLTLVYV